MFLGPTLHPQTMAERIRERWASESYRARLSALDTSEAPVAGSLSSARRRLLEAPPDSVVWTYVYLQVRDPRFDNLTSGMPVLNMSDRDARTLADHLVGTLGQQLPPSEPPPPGLIDHAYSLLNRAGLVPDPLRYRHVAVAFAVGALLSLCLAGVVSVRSRRKGDGKNLP